MEAGGSMDITGRKLFVKALQEEGVETIFGYPGGMVTDLFDELYKQDGIEVVLPRHEQGLLHEAEGYAKATGKVGVCLVTSGPGATNIITGLADAHYDNIPLVCFTGQVPLNLIGNDAFQEVDIVGMTRSVTKYGVTVRDRKDLGRIIKMAFHIATTGNPGPVLIDIPKDIQVASGPAVYPDKVEIRGYKPSTGVHIGQLKKGYKLLKAAKKPLFLIGGGVNAAKANKELLELVERTKIPVVTTVMGKGAIPTDHPYYIGNSGMHGRYAANLAVSECDVLFSIGTRFNDRITGDLNEFAPNAKIVHVDIDTASISRNVVVDVPIVADAKLAIQRLLEWAEPQKTEKWRACIAQWEEENPLQMRRDRGLTPQMIMEGINQEFDEGIIVTDAKQLFGGLSACPHGCMGLGDCEAACQYGAIKVCNGVAVVYRELCVGCGMCAKACPNNVIRISPEKNKVIVQCKSKDTGAKTRKVCSNGCIGCKKCEKTCKFDAVHVVDNVAMIDPEKCKNCGMCAKECPTGAIINLRAKRKPAMPEMQPEIAEA